MRELRPEAAEAVGTATGRRALLPGLLLGWLALSIAGCAGFSLPGAGRDVARPRVEHDAYRDVLRLDRAGRGGRVGAARAAKPPATLDQKLREGDASRASGELGRALWSYLQAHKLDRDDPEPVARIAALHLKDDPQRARDLFADLAARHPESITAHTGLGLAELAQGDLERARASLLRAVEIDAAASALAALGVTLDQMGEYEEAQENYRRALELRPNSYAIHNNLGVSYLMTGAYEQAVSALQRASLLQPHDAAVRNNLGMALARLERYEEALEQFQRAGGEEAALNNLGYAYYLNGRYGEAIQHYERALTLGGKDRLLILRNLRTAREAASHQDGVPRR